MRMLLGLVLLFAAMVPGVATAQYATPETCRPSAMRANKLVPQEIEGGLYFAGKPGTMVTDPFVLPQGIVLVTADMRAPSNGGSRVQIYQTDGGSGATYNTFPVSKTGPYSGTTVVNMQESREVFLAIEATGVWELTLEFSPP